MKNKYIYLSIILVLVISVGIYFFKQQTLYGYTVLSIDEAHYISNSPEVNGDAYLIDLVVNGGGERLKGTITPEMISSLGITKVPSGNFSLDIEVENISCNYDVIDDEQLIYKIYQATVRYSVCHSRCGYSGCLKAGCPYNRIDLNTVKKACRGEWGRASRQWYGGTTHVPQYCGKTYAPMGTDVASPGSPPAEVGNCDSLVNIQNSPINPSAGGDASEWCYAMPQEIMWDGNHFRVTHIAGYPLYHGFRLGTAPKLKYTIKVTLKNAEGNIATTTLTEKDRIGAIADIGRIKFVGNLLADQFCPQPAIDYSVVKNLENNQMKLVKRRNYEHYLDVLNELINFDNNYYVYVNTDPGVGADVLWDKMSTLNSEFRNIYTQNYKVCDIKGSYLNCKPEGDIIYPELQLLIRADWIGVEATTGKPEIRDAYIDEVPTEGKEGILKVKVKNVGEETDNFDIVVTCSDNKVLVNDKTIQLEPSESDEVRLTYRGTEGNHNCSIKVTSVNNPFAYDTQTINLVVEKLATPELPSCKNVPKQPCPQAIWQGYPICKWDIALCEKKPTTNIFWYILTPILAFGLIYIIIKLVKKK